MTLRHWTLADKQSLRVLVATGLTDRIIARRLNRTDAAIAVEVGRSRARVQQLRSAAGVAPARPGQARRAA